MKRFITSRPGQIQQNQFCQGKINIPQVTGIMTILLGHVAQSVMCLTADPGVTSLIPVPYFCGY